MKENPELIIVNALECCEGNVTRSRETVRGKEEATIDLFIVCQRIMPYIKHMKVDHEGKYQLTNYKPTL